MIYTIGEMSKKLNMQPSTLRYYDKLGLLPFVQRTKGGKRIFNDADYEWIFTISCLKKTGMQLDDIKNFINMALKGDETIEPRLAMIVEQKKHVKKQIFELTEMLETLEFKEWYYKTAKKYGTTDIPKNMTVDELPDNLKSVYLKLKDKTMGY